MKTDKIDHLFIELESYFNGWPSELKNGSVAVAHVVSAEKQFEELKRIAKIGEIVEKIFLNGGSVETTTKLPGYENPIPFGIYTVEELFKWAEREEKR